MRFHAPSFVRIAFIVFFQILVSQGLYFAHGQSVQTPTSTVNYMHPETGPPAPSYSALSQSGRETLSAGTGQISVFLPILKLPQKNGSTLTLGYFYGNNTWTIKQTSVQYNSFSTSADPNVAAYCWLETYATYAYVNNQTGTYSNSLNVNIPSLRADIQYAGGNHLNQGSTGETWTGSYCTTNWTFSDWNGVAHYFDGYQDCDQTGSLYPGNHVQPEAMDDSGYSIDTSTAGDPKVIGPDGTAYHFNSHNVKPSGSNLLNAYSSTLVSQVDTNGNTISIANGVLTDTTGRQIQVTSSGFSWQSNGKPASVSLSQSNSGQTGSFPTNWLPSCAAKDPSVYAGTLGSYSGWHGPTVALPQPPKVSSSYTDIVTLPDGSYYQLDYDATSRLVKIRYPEGGYTRYEYDLWHGNSGGQTDDGDSMCIRPKIAVSAKHVCTDAHGACSPSPPLSSNPCQAGSPAGGEQTTCYVIGDYGASVTEPNGRTTNHSFTLGFLDSSIPSPGYQKTYYSELETGRTTFALGSTTTPVSSRTTHYTTPISCPNRGERCEANTPDVIKTSYYDNAGNVTAIAEHDSTFQYPFLPLTDVDKDFSGAEARSSAVTYASGGIFSGTPQSGGLYHLLNRVQNVSEKETATGKMITATNVFDAVGNVVRVDSTATNAPPASTKVVRDSAGQVIQAFDAMQTSGVHHGYTALSYSPITITGCSSANVSGLPTQVTDALGHSTQIAYDSIGQRTCIQDPNGKLTRVSFDALGRITEVDKADGGITTAQYSASTPMTSTQSILQGPTTQTLLDGLGRPTQVTENPSSDNICSEVFYDSVGHIYATNDPRINCAGSVVSGASIQNSYDALDRKTFQTNEDNKQKQWLYSSVNTTTTDEAGNSIKHNTDALGRLVGVIEPNLAGTLSLATNYTYDGFNNLLSATQAGTAGEAARTRSFQYDGFSRLLIADNKETGKICYGKWNNQGSCSGGYDANGNLLFKTDARGILTTYSYDDLNRLTSKSYSGDISNTRPAYYSYDGLTIQGAAAQGTSNAIGRLTTSDGGPFAKKLYAYDAVGRINSSNGCYNGYFYKFNAWGVFDMAGNLTQINYPGGHRLDQVWDASGHLKSSSAQNMYVASGPISILQSAKYFADGSPNIMTLGNGAVVENFNENSRLQLQSLDVSSPLTPFSGRPLLSHMYCYAGSGDPGCPAIAGGNNGNILGVLDQYNHKRDQTFGYDASNRINTFAVGGTLLQHFDIDSFGNLYTGPYDPSKKHFDASNRRIDLPCKAVLPDYDAAGNQLCDTSPDGNVYLIYTYDAENRVSAVSTSANPSSPIIRYDYYADGSRARKIDPFGNNLTAYVDFNGVRLTDIDQHNGATEYFYANGQKIAMTLPNEHRLHTHGVFNGDWNELSWRLPMPKNADGSDYTMKANDLLCLRQYGTGGGVGGPAVSYPDGTNSAWRSPDTAGEAQLNQYGGQSTWRQRCADITMGGTRTGPITSIFVLTDVNTPAGTWDLYFADMSIISTDGTVHQVDLTPGSFGSQNLHGNGWQGTPTATLETVATRDDTTVGVQQSAIHFFVNDALGTSQMELSAAGYPVWQGQFAPFGAELDTQTTNNNYKFTGKERDTESGLDYFGARYYASSMGRFMSPDWAATASPVPYANLADPQSLNLYSYVRNNPLSRFDVDGHVGLNNGSAEPCYSNASGSGCFTQQQIQDAKQAQQQQNPFSRYVAAGDNGPTHVLNGHIGRDEIYDVRQVRNGELGPRAPDHDLELHETVVDGRKGPHSDICDHGNCRGRGTITDSQGTSFRDPPLTLKRTFTIDGQPAHVWNPLTNKMADYQILHLTPTPGLVMEYKP